MHTITIKEQFFSYPKKYDISVDGKMLYWGRKSRLPWMENMYLYRCDDAIDIPIGEVKDQVNTFPPQYKIRLGNYDYETLEKQAGFWRVNYGGTQCFIEGRPLDQVYTIHYRRGGYTEIATVKRMNTFLTRGYQIEIDEDASHSEMEILILLVLAMEAAECREDREFHEDLD